MADDDPYAKFVTAPSEEDPYAKFVKKDTPKVGSLEDAAKGGASGLAQGIIALPGAGGDIQGIVGAAASKPMGWLKDTVEGMAPGAFKWLRDESAKTANLPAAQTHSGDMPVDIKLPTSADIQGQVEKATGPFYQAQTPLGKGVQTAAQVAPALMTGGEGLVPTLAKAAGAGAVSEGAGEAADALKGHLPTSVAPYAEPVARAAGAVAGGFMPSMARRAVTPLPMTDERMQMVQALNQTNPELVNASSAGQLTESPRIASLEGRAPRMADLPQRQNEAYTQGVMRQAGAPSGAMFDTPGLAAAKGNGDLIDILQNANRMSPTEFNLLNRGVGQDRRGLFREVGQSPAFDSARDAIRNGPTGGNPPPLDMTGERYGALKQIVQNAGENAPTTHEQTAIFNTRQRMQDAFHNSMPPEESEQLRNLDRQYSNFKTIENIPAKAGQNTVTPDQVFGRARRGSDLKTHADQASQVMQPLPKPGEAKPSVPGAVLGAAVGLSPALFGHNEAALLGGPFTSYYAMNHLGNFMDATKNAAGRGVARPGVQDYLKNQRWRPGVNSSSDPSVIARILMAPPVTQLLPDQTK